MNTDGASILWRGYAGCAPDRVTRLTGGQCNHVFRVEVGDQSWILRVAPQSNRGVLEGSVHWLPLLAQACVPVPRLVAADLGHATPYLVLQDLPGTDLGVVYPELSVAQKRELAHEVWACQRRVADLPCAAGFGYLASYADSGALPTWKAVVVAHLERSRDWMCESGLNRTDLVDRLVAALPRFDAELAAVVPEAFLDDATTKNVLVHEGRLSAIVDLDWLAFGDPLYAVALTRMSLLAAGLNPDYARFLAEEAGIGPVSTPLLDLYTLCFCVDFLGGLGMQFNQPVAPTVDPVKVEQLVEIYEDLVLKGGTKLTPLSGLT